jgi:hypothetical protein
MATRSRTLRQVCVAKIERSYNWSGSSVAVHIRFPLGPGAWWRDLYSAHMAPAPGAIEE